MRRISSVYPPSVRVIAAAAAKAHQVSVPPARRLHRPSTTQSTQGRETKHQVETDYVGAGAFPLRFDRTYDSSRTWFNNPIPIGVAWTHRYLASVQVMPSQGSSALSEALVYRPDGSVLLFTLQSGVWTPDADVALRLSVSLDGNGDFQGATIITMNDDVETYDSEGRLSSITNRDGLTQTLSYSTTSGGNTTSHNDVQQVIDPQGHTLTFGYNGNGQLATLTDGNGAITQYNYDTNNNLSSVLYPDLLGATKTRTYSYNEAGQVNGASWPNALTGITDENNARFASWGYDSTGRAVLGVHGLYASGTIDKTTLTFNSNGTTSFTDALGQTRIYGFTVKNTVAHPASLNVACDSCSAHDKARAYDANGYSSSSTDFNGNKMTFSFSALDANGHPRGLEGARYEGIPPTGSSDTSAKRYVQTTWSANFRVPTLETIKDASTATLTTLQMTRWVYNTRGQATFRCLVDPNVTGASTYVCGSKPSAPLGVRQWAWTYCESGAGCPIVGLVMTTKGPRTDVNDLTSYTYYPSPDLSGCATGGACHYLGDLQTVTDPLHHVTTYVTYDGNGRPSRTLDANGVPTDLTYHPRGWLTQLAVRNASTGTSTSDRITTYTYDGVGQAIQITQPVGDYRIFGYDNAHRLTDVTDKANQHIHYVLDDAGNRKEEDYYIGTSLPTRKVLRDYNALGRLADVKNANTSQPALAMSYLYDTNGNLQQTTDGRSHITISSYDPRNRLVKSEQDSTGLNVFTIYTYDNLDHLVDVQDPQGLHTHYTTDALNNLTQLSSPDTGITAYGYDTAGNRVSKLDARNVPSSSTYDAINRLTGVTYPNTPSLNIGYTWDLRASGCAIAFNFAVGHLAQVTDSSGNTQFCYDRYNETARKIETIAAAAPFTLSLAYDKDANLSSLTDPDGTIVAYTRDAAERIHTVKYKLNLQTVYTPVVNNVAFYSFGPINKITYGNGRALTGNYDLDYVVSSLSDPASGGLNLTYGRDAVSNLTQIASGSSGNILVYDGLNRLQSVTDLSSTPVWTYGYDATSNRTSQKQGLQNQVLYAYPVDSHHLMAVGNVLRGYDANGNTTSIGAGTVGALGFGYDDTNRVYQVTTGTANAVAMQYLTTASGQRVEKFLTGNPALTQYAIRDLAGRPVGEFDSATNRIRETLWMDNQPVGLLSGTTASLSYIEPDHLGTPRTAIDATSNLAVWQWPLINDPFGQTQPNNLNGSTLTFNLRLPGQEYDPESGESYNLFRDYDASVGRYLESDPIGLKGGDSATYDYVQDNPLRWLDPQGLAAVSPVQNCNGNHGLTYCDGNGGILPDNCDHKCTRACTQAHENQHKQWAISQYGSDVCKKKAAGAYPIPDYILGPDFILANAQTECLAWKVNQQCIKKMKSKPVCYSPDCQSAMSSDESAHDYWRNYYKCDAYHW